MSLATAQEVLMLALINRARLDPAGEAARYGIALNEGLPAGTISAASKQPLAFSDSLNTSADAHSQAMIDSDFFAHTNPYTGSTPQSRATAAGYVGGVGENIAWSGSTGAIDATSMIFTQEEDLFVDSGIDGRGHRTNLLDADYQEVGVGQVLGVFSSGGTGYNASMITQDFGIPAGSKQFLTGIAYNDTDLNNFYSVGEARSGVTVTSSVSGSTITNPGGDYARSVAAGVQTVTFSGGGLPTPVSVSATITAGTNALIDLVGTSTVATSVSLTAISGVTTIVGLGNLGLALSGSGGNNVIWGSAGNDVINGGAGADYLDGGAGFDLATYANAATGLFASMTDSSRNTGEAAGDTYFSIEGLIGSFGADTLVSSANGGNQLWGGAGNDQLYALGGRNYVNGGNDNDNIFSNGGFNTIDGGSGFDLARYDYATAGVVAALDPSASPYNTGAASGDTYTSVEGLVGSPYRDVLFGDAAGNQLYGQNGNDFLIGNGGDDVLFGGAGANEFLGGAGNDAFDFYASEFQAGLTNQIDDFGSTAGNFDRIYLLGVLPGNVSFVPLNTGTSINIVVGGGASTIFVAGAGLANVQNQISFI
jgi:Ca2+-binding RTX toxin-like protein